MYITFPSLIERQISGQSVQKVLDEPVADETPSLQDQHLREPVLKQWIYRTCGPLHNPFAYFPFA